MTCFHPIKAFIVGETPENKKILKFVKESEKDVEQIELNGKIYTEYYLLPCGRCIGCHVDRSKDWATRLMLELRYHEKACFITLTYNDNYLRSHNAREYVDQNGEFGTSYTLDKTHFQKFMKRLRRYYKDVSIRYFACGEYGTKTHRPHYHAILFGVDFSEDRKVHSVENGYVTYTSRILDERWTDPETGKQIGYTLIAPVNWNTCAYVARYVTKKKVGSHNIYYQTFNIEPEFNLMSRRPGIASQFYSEHGEEVYINQEIFMPTSNGVMKFRPPKYYDKLYEIEYPDEMEEIKRIRKECAENAMLVKMSETDRNYFEQLRQEEQLFIRKISSLKREKVQ